jgi:hypothetical protein
MKKFIFFPLVLVFLHATAQQCGNCKTTPSVASYDFHIQVTEPEEDAKDLESWKQLFWLAKHANAFLFQNNKSCIRFIQAPSVVRTDESFVTKDGVEVPNLLSPGEIMKLGNTIANLPAPGNAAYGDYITTGNVKRSGNGYVLHLEIQTACDRKVVTSADVPFQLSSDSKYIEGIAHQAAAKLTPLVNKIKEFELRDRIERKDFALGDGSIKIISSKKSLLPGETVDITVQLTDCDGVALGGREIVFTASNNALKIPGTIGGTVSPAKVISDASGKATAKFKMTAALGHPAIINAHTLTATGKNCADAFMGSTKVDAMQGFKIEIDYTMYGNSGLSMNLSSDMVALSAGEGRNWKGDYTITAFHYPPATQKPDKPFYVMADFIEEKVEIEPLVEEIEIEPLVQENEKMEIPPLINYAQGSKFGKTYLYYSGNAESHSWEKAVTLERSFMGAPPPDPLKYKNIQFDQPSTPVIGMMFKNNELIFFSCDLEFRQGIEGRDFVSTGFSIKKDDPEYFPLKPRKITDPNSPYKWEYIINYKKTDASKMDLGLGKGESTEVATATVRIYSAF